MRCRRRARVHGKRVQYSQTKYSTVLSLGPENPSVRLQLRNRSTRKLVSTLQKATASEHLCLRFHHNQFGRRRLR
jgi:transcriptional regulator of met regulon